VATQDATSLLERLTADRRHRYWSELPALDVRAFAHATGHQQVMDAYLVWLARHHKGRVVTFDTRLTAHDGGGAVVTTIAA
jgi:predicted nucleic acid-binding protein